MVELAVSLFLAAVPSVSLLWAIGAFRETWWLFLWGMTMMIAVLTELLYPRAIAPLFQTLVPVEGEELDDALAEILAETSAEDTDVYIAETDGTAEPNAYVAGFGSSWRVVLCDTLVEQLDRSEFQSIVAHEIGHRQRGHVWKRLAAEGVTNVAVFGTLFYLVSAGVPETMFGLPANATYAALVVAGWWTYPITQFSAPLKNWTSRSNEFEADAYAVDVMGDDEPLANALTRLSRENASNPVPHPLYAMFSNKHPPIPERIEHVRAEMQSGRDAKPHHLSNERDTSSD